MDPDKLAKVEKQYGTIEEKYVIYNGTNDEVEDIQYLNAEKYLNNLIHHSVEH